MGSGEGVAAFSGITFDDFAGDGVFFTFFSAESDLVVCFGVDNGAFGAVFCGDGFLFGVVFGVEIVFFGVDLTSLRGGVLGGAVFFLLGDTPHSLMGRVRSRSASFHTSHCC